MGFEKLLFNVAANTGREVAPELVAAVEKGALNLLGELGIGAERLSRSATGAALEGLSVDMLPSASAATARVWAVDRLREAHFPNYPVTDLSSSPESVSPFSAGAVTEAGQKLFQYRNGLEQLIQRLAPGIKEQRWHLLVDDVSGRTPGNFVAEVTRDYARDTGTKSPQIFYVASGRGGLSETGEQIRLKNSEHSPVNLAALTERVGMVIDKLRDRRALIITDFMHSGGSVARIGHALNAHGVDFDVASVARLGQALLREIKMNHPLLETDVKFFSGDGSLYSGGPGNDWSSLREAAGVEKYLSEGTSRVTQNNQPLVNMFRHETNDLAYQIYRKVFLRS